MKKLDLARPFLSVLANTDPDVVKSVAVENVFGVLQAPAGSQVKFEVLMA